MNNINIFVSSTCYDLSQIRTDISEFIKKAGHTPVLSEFENFPISPELDTIDNCIKIVKENADILVLIVGSRYGSIANNGKSITNTEFLVAKQKGIPIFCFIDKSMLNALNFWRNNKTADFTYIVDNVKIFEFIDDIRNNSKIWTFPFEKAQDIISTLKIQLSYLFKSSLKIKKIFDEEIPDFFKLNLSDKALKILFEKEDIFEYLFLSQVLVDEIEKKEFLRNDIEYSILTEPKYFIEDYRDIPKWVNERTSSIQNIISSFNNIVNNALPIFIGKPGEPSDLKGLYYIAVKYAELYESLLNWIIVTRSTDIGEEFKDSRMVLADYASSPAKDIWNFPFDIHNQIKVAHEKIKLGEKSVNIECQLTLAIDNDTVEKFSEILERLRKYYGI
ncbi:DUF4062 domain-containing protein [Chryseobacterium sp. Ch-15]|uniref:DUF4062 domain-containing protein n=1 Tax=Chryseobacterium muglaense TaxID=2893752 RepID=A0A9Q3UX25_9FLAO|nr:DUF4062 domain-containing protein [Chryseobacterium muglaense]MBD3903478.1 DUF4062 domain-containing protein [Chryseobacterium muglaense]MCC9034550.1 DUF4062 domain-containing protein [Chryseobacterium muglaense]MCM2552813.1 DUF4062 domain-containing protein [Chryseobacterium muglaense]